MGRCEGREQKGEPGGVGEIEAESHSGQREKQPRP